MLVDRPVQLRPPAGYFHIRLVGKPPVPGRMPENRAASMNSEVNRCTRRHTVRDHGDAALGQQLPASR